MDFQVDAVIKAFPDLATGSLVTLKISILSFLFASLIGFGVGILRSQSHRLFLLFLPYVEIFRGTPLLIQLFFIYYGLPSIGINLGNTEAAIIGLSLNGGAYISEAIRGSLLAVPSGQKEAAYSQGLSWFSTMYHVILPQAVRVALPSLSNIFASLLKETSLISVLAITELTRVGQLVYTRTFRAFEIYLFVGLLYLVMTLTITYLSRKIEERMQYPYLA